jgi:1-acyl-sn-glycerol-3-phosphate acyltransferase
MAIYLVWTLALMPVQAIGLLLRQSWTTRFPRFYHRQCCRILGLRVRQIGEPVMARPVLFASNHVSYADITVLGSLIAGSFVAKSEMASWPLYGWLAKLQRSVFVDRQVRSTAQQRDAIAERLASGDALILFPEGTSSDGSRVLPFRSSFLAAAYADAKPLIQPVSVVYDRLAGLPVGHASRDVFAWYGDMTLAPHFWQVAQYRGKRVTLLFHTPMDPADYADRKALAQAIWQVVADGAAALRQNRPAKPLPEIRPAAIQEPAFA